MEIIMKNIRGLELVANFLSGCQLLSEVFFL